MNRSEAGRAAIVIAMAPTAATSIITNGRDKAMRLPDRFGINKPRMNSVLCDRMAMLDTD